MRGSGSALLHHTHCRAGYVVYLVLRWLYSLPPRLHVRLVLPFVLYRPARFCYLPPVTLHHTLRGCSLRFTCHVYAYPYVYVLPDYHLCRLRGSHTLRFIWFARFTLRYCLPAFYRTHAGYLPHLPLHVYPAIHYVTHFPVVTFSCSSTLPRCRDFTPLRFNAAHGFTRFVRIVVAVWVARTTRCAPAHTRTHTFSFATRFCTVTGSFAVAALRLLPGFTHLHHVRYATVLHLPAHTFTAHILHRWLRACTFPICAGYRARCTTRYQFYSTGFFYSNSGYPHGCRCACAVYARRLRLRSPAYTVAVVPHTVPVVAGCGYPRLHCGYRSVVHFTPFAVAGYTRTLFPHGYRVTLPLVAVHHVTHYVPFWLVDSAPQFVYGSGCTRVPTHLRLRLPVRSRFTLYLTVHHYRWLRTPAVYCTVAGCYTFLAVTFTLYTHTLHCGCWFGCLDYARFACRTLRGLPAHAWVARIYFGFARLRLVVGLPLRTQLHCPVTPRLPPFTLPACHTTHTRTHARSHARARTTLHRSAFYTARSTPPRLPTCPHTFTAVLPAVGYMPFALPTAHFTDFGSHTFALPLYAVLRFGCLRAHRAAVTAFTRVAVAHCATHRTTCALPLPLHSSTFLLPVLLGCGYCHCRCRTVARAYLRGHTFFPGYHSVLQLLRSAAVYTRGLHILRCTRTPYLGYTTPRTARLPACNRVCGYCRCRLHFTLHVLDYRTALPVTPAWIRLPTRLYIHVLRFACHYTRYGYAFTFTFTCATPLRLVVRGYGLVLQFCGWLHFTVHWFVYVCGLVTFCLRGYLRSVYTPFSRYTVYVVTYIPDAPLQHPWFVTCSYHAVTVAVCTLVATCATIYVYVVHVYGYARSGFPRLRCVTAHTFNVLHLYLPPVLDYTHLVATIHAVHIRLHLPLLHFGSLLPVLPFAFTFLCRSLRIYHTFAVTRGCYAHLPYIRAGLLRIFWFGSVTHGLLRLRCGLLCAHCRSTGLPVHIRFYHAVLHLHFTAYMLRSRCHGCHLVLPYIYGSRLLLLDYPHACYTTLQFHTPVTTVAPFIPRYTAVVTTYVGCG